MTRQDVSIVSDMAGTTTDPVEKPMELLPFGPVLFIDTAGHRRCRRARRTTRREDHARFSTAADVGVIVVPSRRSGGASKSSTRRAAASRDPVIVVFNKRDLGGPAAELLDRLQAGRIGVVNDRGERGARASLDLREALIALRARGVHRPRPRIVGDLVPAGELGVLVVPIDLEAPKGRLILPQVQTIRDLLDNDAYCMVVKERELRDALDRLKRPPALVVTDSQAFLKVAADTPPERSADQLLHPLRALQGRPGRASCAGRWPSTPHTGATACSSPRPARITRSARTSVASRSRAGSRQYVGGKLEFDHVPGARFPRRPVADTSWSCTAVACMRNRREMLVASLAAARQACRSPTTGWPSPTRLGIFDRALAPIPGCSRVVSGTRLGHRSRDTPKRARRTGPCTLRTS